jgi:hypothetical protein
LPLLYVLPWPYTIHARDNLRTCYNHSASMLPCYSRKAHTCDCGIRKASCSANRLNRDDQMTGAPTTVSKRETAMKRCTELMISSGTVMGADGLTLIKSS